MTSDVPTDQDLLADSGSLSSGDHLTSDQPTDRQLIGYQIGGVSDINDSEQPSDLNNAPFFNEEQLISKAQPTDEDNQPLGMRRRHLGRTNTDRQMLTSKVLLLHSE